MSKYRSVMLVDAIKHNLKNKFEVLDLVKDDPDFKSCSFDDYGTVVLNFEKPGGFFPNQKLVRVGEYLIKRGNGNYSTKLANEFESEYAIIEKDWRHQVKTAQDNVEKSWTSQAVDRTLKEAMNHIRSKTGSELVAEMDNPPPGYLFSADQNGNKILVKLNPDDRGHSFDSEGAPI